MARHFRPHNRPSRTSHVLSILLSLLPLVLLLASFILAAISSSSKDWSHRIEYTGIFPEISPTIVIHRSPFWSCSAIPNNTDSAGWTESCSHVTSPRGLCDFDAPTSDKSNSPLFCQQLSVSAHLLYAGSALVGAALFVVLLLTAVTLPSVVTTGSVRVLEPGFLRPHDDGDDPGPRHHGRFHLLYPPNHAPQAYFSAILAVLSALGALALLLGVLFAVTSLTIVQFNQGDWFSTGDGGTDPTEEQYNGPWLLGGAAGQCAAGAVLAGVSAFVTRMVWEGPRVGVWEWQRLRGDGAEEVAAEQERDLEADRGVNGEEAPVEAK